MDQSRGGLIVEALEQLAQLKHRASATIRHDWSSTVIRTIDQPRRNARRVFAVFPVNSITTRLTFFALRSDKLPTVARTGTGIINSRGEAGAVQSNNVKRTIFDRRIVRPGNFQIALCPQP